MSEGAWDNEDYEPPEFTKPAAGDRWEGEDEEDDIKDNWYDEDTSEKAEDDKPEKALVSNQIKKKRAQIIAEKEERRREQIAKAKEEMENKNRLLTPEEELAEKLKQQQLQEDADLELAKEAFGVTTTMTDTTERALDSMLPSTKEEFDEFRKALVTKMALLEKSAHFVLFLEDLFREICINMDPDDIKKITSSLNAIANEKVKAQKMTKHKKKIKGKASLNLGSKNTPDYELGNFQDEYEDFI